MTFLLTQIFLCLLGALLIGIVATWFFQRNKSERREAIIQQDYRSRLRQIELDRDRSVRNLSAQIERLKSSQSTKTNDPGGASQYQEKIDSLEERILERETAIGEQRSQIKALRSELAQAESAFHEQMAALNQQHEEQVSGLQAEVAEAEERGDDALNASGLEEEARRETDDLRQQLDNALIDSGSLRREIDEARNARDVREQELRRDYEQQLSELQAQLRGAQQSSAAADADSARQRAAAGARQEINALQQSLEAMEHEKNKAIAAKDDLQQKQDTVYANLRAQTEAKFAALFNERERALKNQNQQHFASREVSGHSGGQAERIRQLEAELDARDDSIAVLRDDLAELRDDKNIGSRGRQDEQLRLAMAEAIEWQEKYEQAAAELAALRPSSHEQHDKGMQTNGPDPKTPTQRSGAQRISDAIAGKNRSDDRPLENTGNNPGLGSGKLQDAQVPPAKKDTYRPQAVAGAESAQAMREAMAAENQGAATKKLARDNLQTIKGIGPALEKVLNENGIYRFQQIAELDATEIERLAGQIGRFGNRITRDNWVEQAKQLQRERQ